jgi:pSer/pThr/pTyr-binding forkhead associated (FHA) protein
MATLEVIKGENAGQIYQLTDNESVVGRYPFCEVVIPSHTVSRQHARISCDHGEYYIEDLNSLNGTFINGKRIKSRSLLKNEDRIRIYDMLLLFHEKTIDKPRFSKQKDDSTPRAAIDDTPAHPEPLARVVINAFEVQPKPPQDEQGRARMKAALAVSQKLVGATDVDVVLPAIVDHVFELFPQAERGHLLLVDDDGALLPKAVKHRDDTQGVATMAPISRKMAARVMSKGEAFIAARGDIEDDEDSSASIFGSGVSTMMCAPLIGPSRTPLGIIHLDTSDSENAFDKADLELLISVGLVAGQAAEFALLSDA